MNWMHKVGKQLLKEGALTYIITDDAKSHWGDYEETKQKTDMIALYNDHVRIIELKETINLHTLNIKYKHNTNYETRFYAFVYWKEYNIITGTLIENNGNLQFHAIDTSGELRFFVSIGEDPKTRIKKEVEIKIYV